MAELAMRGKSGAPINAPSGKPRGDLTLIRGGLDYRSKVDMKWIKGRVKDMVDERELWRPQWVEIGQFIAPRRSHFLSSQDLQRVDGRKRNQKILNSKATRSVRRAVAGFQSGISPKAVVAPAIHQF